MNRRIVLKVALTLLLVSTLILVFNVQISSASGTVYIRADGSIDPPSANITSADNATYTLIGNVNDSVVVQRANIVLDGAGYTVQGAGNGVGINVTGASNVTTKNCVIKSFHVGIYVDVGADSDVTRNNTIQGMSGATGEDAVGIYLRSSYNAVFNNAISNLSGGTGASGGSGGTSAGIYLSASTGNNLTLNTITGLTGGTGGAGVSVGSGGSGGTSAGIYLSSSTGNSMSSNTMAGLTGGTGGRGDSYAPDGSRGTSAGIWLDTNSYDNRITILVTQGSYKVPDASKLNTVEGKPILYFYNETSAKVSDFNVTTQTAPILIGGSTSSGGAGGFSTGLALISTKDSVVQNNTVSGFNGMSGGTGGGSWGSGGSGGTSAGIYLSASTGNNLTLNTITGLTGGTGGTGGSGYGSGGSGGASAGIYLSNSTGNDLTASTVANLTGGTGGTGGSWGSGGSGGTSAGIYLSSSTGINLTASTVANLTGGAGGTGGYGGSSGAKGTSYSLYLYQANSTSIQRNTLETADYCLYLYSSSNSTIYHNNFIVNASPVYSQNSNNTWNNGYPSGGNYWSNFTGVDNYKGPHQNETGSDGIGDTPFQIDPYNRDNYPVMHRDPWVHDVAIINMTFSTTEAYAGQTVEINATARNCGSRYESFNITAYYDDSTIETREISGLAPDTETSLTFNWNTTDVSGGYYTISANTSTIAGEIYTTNNAFANGVVKITSPVRIVEVIPCNQTGYPKDTFQQGTIAYFKVTVNSTALIPQNTLITINLYDNSSITIGVVSIQGPTWPGTSTIIFGLPIPSTTTTGTGTVYANAYTDWPSQGGFPHCPEMSATLEITGS